MTGNKGWRGLIVLVFIAALACPMLGQTAGGKIKVIVENASLRVKPSMDSEVLEENIPVATVFNVEKKAGEWYEVKYQSKLGVMITGYIHEMYVEAMPSETEVKPVESPKKEEPKRAPATPQSYAPGPAFGHKFELGLGFGLGSGSFLGDTSPYDYTWGPVTVLRSVHETGTLNHSVKSPIGLGASLTYYISGGLGVRLRADMNFRQNITGTSSGYDVNWAWNSGATGSYHFAGRPWDLTGNMTVTPLSLNLLYKFRTETSFQPYVTGGLSYFTGSVNGTTTTLKMITFIISPFQFLDLVVMPIHISDASLSSVGGNFGLGADIYVSPNIALNLDATYFLGKSFDVKWIADPGNYRTLAYDVLVNVTQATLNNLQDNALLKVSTSFFKIMAGLKIGF